VGGGDRAINLMGRFAAGLVDHRGQAQVEHTIATMVARRVFGIALGYEDVVDHAAPHRPSRRACWFRLVLSPIPSG
jgi:hypothetical protein